MSRFRSQDAFEIDHRALTVIGKLLRGKLPTFLIEFVSLRAALAYVGSAGDLNSAFQNIALISPAAQEYLQPAQPARDPDLMMAAREAAVTLPHWRLILQGPRNGFTAQELAPSAEEDLRRALQKFSHEILERHKNAMIIRFDLPLRRQAQAIASAEAIAFNYNFINPAVAERDRVTLAFVPLSVDPPAAMHYSKVIEELIAEVGDRFKVVSCPREVTPYMRVPIRSKVSLVSQAIRKIFGRSGT